MQLGAFTARMVIDGKPLEEYDVEHESPTKVACWVPSEEGKSFSVEWKCHEGARILASEGCLKVDGTSCGSMLMYPGTLGMNDTKTHSTFIGRRMERGLMFTRVKLSNDDSVLEKEIPEQLGEICLKIRRGGIVRERRKPHDTGTNCSKVLGDNKFHERSKKGTVHCVGFGPGIARMYHSHRQYLISSSDPSLTFVFKYRPLGLLQANGIAPRATSSGAGANHGTNRSGRSSPKDSTSDNIELNDRIHNFGNELKRLRDLASSNSEDRNPKRIKIEGLGEQRPRVFDPNDMMDLTL